MNSKVVTIIQGFCLPSNKVKKIFPNLSISNPCEEKTFIDDLKYYSSKFLVVIKNNTLITNGWIFYNNQFGYLKDGFIVAYYDKYSDEDKVLYNTHLYEYINGIKPIDLNHPWPLEIEDKVSKLDEIVTFLPAKKYNDNHYLGILKSPLNNTKLADNSNYINLLREHFKLDTIDS